MVEEITKKEWEKRIKEHLRKQEEWENSVEGIGYEMDSDLDSIPQYAQYNFLRALSYLPKDIREKAISKCVFLSDDKTNTGTYNSLKDKKWKDKKGFIYFSSLLWDSKLIKIDFCVAHEIAHFIQDATTGYGRQFRSFKEEKEADKLAIKWLEKRYKKEKLLKTCSYFHSQEWEKWGRRAKKQDEEFKEAEKQVARIGKKLKYNYAKEETKKKMD
jgi:hypothetical protein